MVSCRRDRRHKEEMERENEYNQEIDRSVGGHLYRSRSEEEKEERGSRERNS